MKVCAEIKELRRERWRTPGLTWGLVPTMGFLHEGHLSLVRRARKENDKVGVSIFVNPEQFNNADDLEAYPRNEKRDLELLQQEDVDLVWSPSVKTVYPDAFQTYVNVEKVSLPLEGKARPGHFRGVATVVAKLFNVFEPHRAYFGQKDAQQVRVIAHMVEDLNFNIEIVACPTVRETDGLAMSSRNANLSISGRQNALCLSRALFAAKEAFRGGERRGDRLRRCMQEIIEQTNSASVDYVSISDVDTLDELDVVGATALASLAVFVNGVRLIDNVILGEAKS